MPPSPRDPLSIPDTFWVRDDVRHALGTRDIGSLFLLVKKYTGASQTKLGVATGFEQGDVSRIVHTARRITAIDVLQRVADGLTMPDDARMRLGLAPRARHTLSPGAWAADTQQRSEMLPGNRPAGDLAMEGFGSSLRRLRRQGGLSPQDLARLTRYDFGYPGQIECGERSASRRLAEACDGALLADRAFLSVHGLDEEAGEMRRRGVLHTLTALALGASAPQVALEALRHGLTRAVDADHDEWQGIAADYARDYFTMSPTDLLDHLGVDLAVLQHLMGAQPDAHLSRAAGQLSVVMAKTLACSGQLGLAGRWWRTARRHADASEDIDTRIWVRAWEVVNGTYANRPIGQVLALADETVALAAGRVCCGTAGVLSGRAQALAVAGRADDAAVALHDVAEITERMPALIMGDAESMFGWPEVRLRHTESYVYTHIGDTARAMAAQDRALEIYPADLERERSQLLMHRASCLIQDGHIADGLRYAADVLDRLPADQHNASLYEVARRVVAVIPQKERARTEVGDLRDRIAALPSR